MNIFSSHSIIIFGMRPFLLAYSTSYNWITLTPFPHPGAGLYSFFHNYKQDRIKRASCQSHLFNVDRDSLCADVSVFGLSTVGTTWMLSVDGEGVIASRVNPNGFAHTATYWSG